MAPHRRVSTRLRERKRVKEVCEKRLNDAAKLKKSHRQSSASKGKNQNSVQREARLKLKREAERARRQAIKANPKKYQEARTAEQKRWQARKATGKVKNIADMTEREKRDRRRKVQQWVRTHRQRKKEEKNITNKCDKIDDEINIQDISQSLEQTDIKGINKDGIKKSRQAITAQKKKKREMAKCYKDLERLRKKYKELERNMARKKKSEWRQMNKEANNNLNPRNTVRKLIKGKSIDTDLKKRLEFGEVLQHQLRTMYTAQRDYKSKQFIGRVICGNIIKKYRMLTKCRELIAPLHPSRIPKSENLLVYSRKTKRQGQIFIERTVTSFFEDNSRMCPGKKDCITRHGLKKQKMFLNLSVQELHTKFRALHPSIKISYTTFCRFRPFWTIHPKVSSRDTCLCIKHENMKLLLQALHRGKVTELHNSTHLISVLTCERRTEDCLQRKCAACCLKDVPYHEINDINAPITYQKWTTVKENRISAKTKKEITVQRTIKQAQETTIGKLKVILKECIKSFLSHVYRIEHQYSVIKTLKNTLTEKDLLLHVDFSENYNCKYGEEPQSVHFGASRESVSLHTGVWYTKGCHQSFATLSPSLRHDPQAIIAHLKPILKKVLREKPQIDHLHFLSDGPTTQYRNKMMFALLTTYLVSLYKQINAITYNISESGHGKGAADGVGGVTKRTADNLVARGNDVSDFDTLVKVLKINVKNIEYETVYEREIMEIDRILPKNLKTFKGTMKMHQWTWSRSVPGRILFNELSCYICKPSEKCKHFHMGESQQPVEQRKLQPTILKKTKKNRKQSYLNAY